MVPVLDMINHQNGRWYNLDSNSSHEGNDIIVFASRDIQAGGQLYLSYNECKDRDNTHSYVLPHTLNDNRFVEPYPRRWNFHDDLVFELDETPQNVSAKGKLQLTWLSEEPNDDKFNILRSQLLGLHSIGDYVSEQAAKVNSIHERDVSLQYYDALVTAQECALLASEEEEEDKGFASVNNLSESCASGEYDALDTVPEEAEFNDLVCNYERARRDIVDSNDYELIDATKSLYQSIEFQYSEEFRDTCIYMDEYLHTCMSFRPHYHEVFVHYPARYLDQVKRVAFLGGGDSMIVHEILKYPSLELVVGLELDQQVVRSSFKNFGTQPRFDDPRLQWWFGDAANPRLLWNL